MSVDDDFLDVRMRYVRIFGTGMRRACAGMDVGACVLL